MMNRVLSIAAVVAIAAFAFACGGKKETSAPADSTATAAITEEVVNYTADTVASVGYVAYANKTEKLPIVLVVPEWWGVTDYTKSRVKQLAELGYLALAVDMYGHGKIANNPDEAKALAMPFYMDPNLAKTRFEAALAQAKTYAQADTSKIAAVGYCFGGSVVLNVAKLGTPLDGVVSFHGGLAGVTPSKGGTKADVLVCHGAADSFVPAAEVTKFKTQMDSVGAHYTFKEYADATHAFTNPEATEIGKKFNLPLAYNEAADKNSWNDMKEFFSKIF